MGNCMTARAIKMPLTPEDFFHLNKFTYFTDHFREKKYRNRENPRGSKGIFKNLQFPCPRPRKTGPGSGQLVTSLRN